MSSTAADGFGLERVFPGKSAMAARMRAFDWSTTDLGAPPTWPSTLRVALGICLTAQLPMQIWWGPARTFFYNDACTPLFAASNQASLTLGDAGAEAWPKLLPQIDPEIEQVFATGVASGPVASRLVFNRNHPSREIAVTFSFSPLLGESGGVEGVFGICSEPPALSGKEQQAFLLKLNDALRPLSDAVEIQRVAMRLVGEFLEVDRALYNEIRDDGETIHIEDNYVRGDFPKVTGDFAVRAFGAAMDILRRGEVLIIEDQTTTPLKTPLERAASIALGVLASATVPLIKEGCWVANFGVLHGSPRQWTENEIGILQETAERTWAAVERARAEAASRTSEEKYHTLFDSIDEGFCVIEIIDDAAGVGIDYRFLEVNRVFERQTGLKNVTGKLCSEVTPGTESYWLENYDYVARTGEPLRVEDYHEATMRWYLAYASRVGGEGSRQVAIVFDDITERKQHERRREFLLKLNDALRFQANAVAIQATATEIVMNHFEADRCYYCEIEDDKAIIRRDAAHEDLPSVAGVYLLKDFPLFKAMMNGGVPLVVQDSRVTDAMDEALKQLCVQMKIISFINIPVVKDNRYTGNLCITRSAPGDWPNFEVKLAEEIAERTWAAVERAKAEEALRASEARIRITVEAAQMATWDWTISTGEVFWNEQHFLLFGMAPQDRAMTSADFFNHVHPDDRAWLGATLQAAIDQRRVFQAEFRSLNEDGSKRWMSGYGRVVAEADGQAMRMSGVMFDITERKEAEEALRESETRQAIILETMAEGVVTIDCDGRFFSANAAAERILGVARSELIGQSIYTPPYQRFDLDGAPWGDHPLLAEIVAAGPRIFHHDYVIERRDGSRVVVSRNITAMLKTAGLVLGFVSTLSDITEQKRTETALRDSEARFRAVANLVPDLLWSNDATDVIDWYNQRWLEYTGQTLEKAAAYGWLNVVHPDERAIALDNFQQALEQGEPFRQEQRLANALGEYRWFLVQATPLKDANGKILRWFGAATDIHEQRIVRETLEQRVQERTHELEALSVSRQQLLDRILKVQEDERRRIAHELHDTLGQFLSALNLRLSLLQQSVQLHDEAASPIAEELGQLWQLVNEIDSELRRLTMELRPPILDDLGLDEAIRRYAEAWSQTTAIPVDVYTAGFAGERLAHTIELPIYRIVQEALTNVLKHAQASTVSVILERRLKELQLIIEDNGVGFDPNAVDSQEEGRRSLGLIGMKERAALVGGWVDLETAPGVGTTVYVHIPLHTDKSELSQDFPPSRNRPS